MASSTKGKLSMPITLAEEYYLSERNKNKILQDDFQFISNISQALEFSNMK